MCFSSENRNSYTAWNCSISNGTHFFLSCERLSFVNMNKLFRFAVSAAMDDSVSCVFLWFACIISSIMITEIVPFHLEGMFIPIVSQTVMVILLPRLINGFLIVWLMAIWPNGVYSETLGPIVWNYSFEYWLIHWIGLCV